MPSDYSLSDVLERLYENQQALETAVMELTRGTGIRWECPWAHYGP